MSSLIHCIYSSAATHEFDSTEMTQLLNNARAANERMQLTGMLLRTDGSFFQVLEGEAAAVDALFAKIQLDPRHTKVTLIIREPIHKRSFADWSMGFLPVSQIEFGEILGTNEFSGKSASFADLDDGRAKKLLTAFADGRWRKKIAGAKPVIQT